MNAYVVSTDRRLLEAVRSSGHFTSVATVSKDMVEVLLIEAEEQGASTASVLQTDKQTFTPLTGALGASSSTQTASGSPADVWLVSDRLLDMHETNALRSLYPWSQVIYMLSNGLDPQAMKTIQSLCASNGVGYTLPYHTAEQVVEQAASISLRKERPLSKVITGVGALPQLGLTSSLLWTGVMLGRLSGVRVGILNLNGWNPGDSGLKYTGKYLDELWGSLQGRQLQAQELPSKMQLLAPNVHYLAGNRDLKKLYYYNTEGVSWLIDKARQCFDLVLIDAGSYPDHALAAQGILASDLLLVQMDQRQQSKVQWQRICDHILQPVFRWEDRQSLLLFNQMHRSPEMENEKQLSRQLGLPYVGSLPFVGAFQRAEAEEGLLAQNWPDYEKELHKVCRALLHYYEIPLESAAAVSIDKENGQSPTLETQGSVKGGSWLRWLKPVRGA